MQEKISLFNNYSKKVFAILGAIVTLLTFVDYLLKWRIYPYIYHASTEVMSFMQANIYQLAVCSWLIVLSYLVWKQSSNNKLLKANDTEKQIGEISKLLQNDLKKNFAAQSALAHNIESKLDSRILEIERTIVDYEIEDHKKKNQIGAMSQLIKKLRMDKKRGWGVEDTLFEIKEYIKDRGMPNTYLSDLNAEINSCPDGLKLLKDDILKLAQEKMYRVG